MEVSSEPYIEAVFPTVHEPELAPEGKQIALCFTQLGAYELRGRSREEAWLASPAGQRRHRLGYGGLACA
jgi:phytoene dehydrogenase-like protein